MTGLLLRLFVKDYKDTVNPAVHTAVGKMAGTVGIVCNLLLFGIKIIAGVLSGAVSIVADALNNLSDAASSVVTLLGFQLAKRPADQDHPYGHARYEYLSGVIIAAMILVIGVELTKSSVEKILMPTPITFSVITPVILVCALAIKFWMWQFYGKLGKRIGSTTLRAAAVDSRNDVLTTAAVLAGWLISWAYHVNVDGYIGLAVALFILVSGIGVAKDTISPLLGEKADRQLVEKISNMVLSNEKVLGIHDLLVHDYGPGKCYASVHVEINAEEDPLVCHDIIDTIECDVLEKLNVNLVIHYDPVLMNDAEWNQMRQTVEDVVRDIEPELSIHDFRLVRGACQTKLVFDLAVPFAMCNKRGEIKEQVETALKCTVCDYTTVIRLDDQC